MLIKIEEIEDDIRFNDLTKTKVRVEFDDLPVWRNKNF